MLAMEKHFKDWDKACIHLGQQDAVMKRLCHRYMGEAMHSNGTAFKTLLRSIVGQQISVFAADAVWNKIAARFKPLTPEVIIRATEADLKSCGLSRQKTSYIQSLAEHFQSKELNPRSWKNKSDEELITLLTKVKGIGVWTAEMFLMFHLLRPNVLPVDDIGLQKAIAQNYFQEEKKASKAQILSLKPLWDPFCSVATWHLWRSLDPIPVQY